MCRREEVVSDSRIRVGDKHSLLREDLPFKLDVEAAEWEILNSVISDPDLPKRASYWMVEFHSSEEHGAELEDILKVFALSGYNNLQKGDVMHFYHA